MRGCGATVGACRGLEGSHLSTPRQRVRPSRPRRWRNGRGSPGRSRICRVRSSSCRTETERSCRGIAAELGRRCTARPRRGSSSRRRDTRPTERQGKSILVCCIWFACICAHSSEYVRTLCGCTVVSVRDDCVFVCLWHVGGAGARRAVSRGRPPGRRGPPGALRGRARGPRSKTVCSVSLQIVSIDVSLTHDSP